MTDPLRIALRRAYSLGQTYWQQADSESYSQNRKSDETQRKFEALVEETIAALAAQEPQTAKGPDLSMSMFASVEDYEAAAAAQPQEPLTTRWLPTPVNVNALQPGLREYVHDLATRCDPSGDIRHLTMARDQVRELEASNRCLRDALAAAQPQEPAPAIAAAVAAERRKMYLDLWSALPAHEQTGDTAGSLRAMLLFSEVGDEIRAAAAPKA